MIRFEFDPEKFASTVVYVAKGVPGATKKVICKLIFFADQRHLLAYGRTITGDVYHALPQGPIPTRGLDMLNQRALAPEADKALMRDYGFLVGFKFKPLRSPNLSCFSRSDLKVLDSTIAELGGLNHLELEDLSHKEAAWIRTRRAQPMDFDLFFEGHPEAQQMREIVNEEFTDLPVA